MPQRLIFGREMPEEWSREKAWGIFQPFADRCFQAVHAGVSAWMDGTTDELRGETEPADESKCIHSLICKRAAEAFVGDVAVRECRSHNIRKLIIANSLVVRFNRIHADNLLVRPTGSVQSDAWLGNDPIEGIADDLLRLTVGHVLVGQTIREVYLTWQAEPTALGWAIRLIGDAGLAGGDDGLGHGGPPLEFGPKTPNVPMVPINPKSGKKKKKEGDVE